MEAGRLRDRPRQGVGLSSGVGETDSSASAPADGEVRVESVSRHRAVQELGAREHRWLADRPRGTGGDGLGPTPLELLLGSFAAQTAMGILDLAREKEWALDSVQVAITQDGTPADGAVRDLSRELVIRGELNDEERRELETEVAARWPRAAWLPPGELRERFSYP